MVGEILFGMDSALECFVFALNAVGYLKDPTGFCDISTRAGLGKIRPENVVSRVAGNTRHVKPACATVYPKVLAHWQKHATLLAEIMEYHDVSKHRSSTLACATPGCHVLPALPKEPGSLYRPASRVLEDMCREFHDFCETLVVEAAQDIAAAFGIPIGPAT